MLEAVFRGQSVFVLVALAITAGAGLGAHQLALRRSDRPVLIGLWVASAVGVLCLTLWSSGGSHVAGNCTVNLGLLEPFRTEQGLLNAAMFVPLGLAGTLVTRRVLPAALAGAMLSCVVETVQGAVPAIGRACDTSDLVANSAGALAGAVIGRLLIGFLARDLAPWTFRTRPTVVGALAGLLALAGVWAECIQVDEVAATQAVGPASARQRQAVETAVSTAFGDYYPVKGVQYMASPGTDRGTVVANLPVGFLQLTWPDRADVTASLDMSDRGAESGFPVPGVTTSPRTAAEARTIAGTYARRHYPWGTHGSTIEVSGVGDHATLGWLVSFRRRRAGVLMPMRLDIEVDRAGRISQLSAREAPDVRVAAATVARSTAARAAGKAVPACTGSAGRNTVTVGELLAVRRGRGWTAVWRTVVSCGSARTVVNVDARTGVAAVGE